MSESESCPVDPAAAAVVDGTRLLIDSNNDGPSKVPSPIPGTSRGGYPTPFFRHSPADSDDMDGEDIYDSSNARPVATAKQIQPEIQKNVVQIPKKGMKHKAETGTRGTTFWDSRSDSTSRSEIYPNLLSPLAISDSDSGGVSSGERSPPLLISSSEDSSQNYKYMSPLASNEFLGGKGANAVLKNRVNPKGQVDAKDKGLKNKKEPDGKDLRNHKPSPKSQKSKTSEKPVLKCPYCKMASRHPLCISRHIGNSHKEKTFKYRCGYCKAVFLSMGYLNQHMPNCVEKEPEEAKEEQNRVD